MIKNENIFDGGPDDRNTASEVSGILSFQTSDFFNLMSSFPSSLEVKSMIDDALHRFEKKSLPRLLAGQADQAGAQVDNGTVPGIQTNNLNPPLWLGDGLAQSGVDTRLSSRDVEWLVMVVRAQVGADLLQQLSHLVEEEVATRLKAFFSKAPLAQPQTPQERPPLPCSPGGKTRQEPCMSSIRQMNLTTALLDDEDYVENEIDSTQLKRDQTLNDLHDVHHQLKCLQRQVNELAHQFRTAERRLAQFFLAFDSAGALVNSCSRDSLNRSPVKVLSAMPPPLAEGKISDSHGTFYMELLAALDACDISKVQRIMHTRCRLFQPDPSSSTGEMTQRMRPSATQSLVKNVMEAEDSINDPVAAAVRHLINILDDVSETPVRQLFEDAVDTTTPDVSGISHGFYTSDCDSRGLDTSLPTRTHRCHDGQVRDTHHRSTRATRGLSVMPVTRYTCAFPQRLNSRELWRGYK